MNSAGPSLWLVLLSLGQCSLNTEPRVNVPKWSFHSFNGFKKCHWLSLIMLSPNVSSSLIAHLTNPDPLPSCRLRGPTQLITQMSLQEPPSLALPWPLLSDHLAHCLLQCRGQTELCWSRPLWKRVSSLDTIRLKTKRTAYKHCSLL